MEESRQRAPYPEVIDEKGLSNSEEGFYRDLNNVWFLGSNFLFACYFYYISFMVFWFSISVLRDLF